jgi:hypothetical protein
VITDSRVDQIQQENRPAQFSSISSAISGVTGMIDEKFARLRSHRNNMVRYRQLLKTELTELERQFVERRLLEEQAMLESLSASIFPLTLKISNPAAQD